MSSGGVVDCLFLRQSGRCGDDILPLGEYWGFPSLIRRGRCFYQWGVFKCFDRGVGESGGFTKTGSKIPPKSW